MDHRIQEAAATVRPNRITTIVTATAAIIVVSLFSPLKSDVLSVVKFFLNLKVVSWIEKASVQIVEALATTRV